MRSAAGSGGALALLLALLWVSPLQAQEGEATARGWLGVGVQEVAECRVHPRGSDRCSELSKRLVVSRVVVGGPADVAGVQLGDTLLAVDDRDLDAGLADSALAAVRPGVPAVFAVGRSGGRRSIRIVPGERPEGPVRMRVAVGIDGVRGVVNVVRARPGSPGGTSAPRRRPGEEPRAPLVLRVQEGGVYVLHRLQPAGTDDDEEGGDGRETVITLAPRVDPDGPRAVGFVATDGGRHVSLEPNPELRALQDSVFRLARSRLDSMRRRLAAFEARSPRSAAREEARGERVSGRRPDAPVPPRTVWSAPFWRSVAGAEFEPLSPELAAFFEGAEEGLLCLRVIAGTPAARLGLRPGDVVVSAAGEPVRSVAELRTAVRRAAERPLELGWIRKGRPMRGTLVAP